MGLRKDIVTTPYDFADYIDTEDDVRTVLGAALEDNDQAAITRKIGAIARSKGMAAIAAATGLQREGLYKSLSETGNPELKTLLKILDALGLVLVIRARRAARPYTAARATIGQTEPIGTSKFMKPGGIGVSAVSRAQRVTSSERTGEPGSKLALRKVIPAKVAAERVAKAPAKKAARSSKGGSSHTKP